MIAGSATPSRGAWCGQTFFGQTDFGQTFFGHCLEQEPTEGQAASDRHQLFSHRGNADELLLTFAVESAVCLVFFEFDPNAELPIMLAANREEELARPSRPPAPQPGPPRVLCGVDALAGGTWLGINQHCLVVAVTNRHDPRPGRHSRSRGLLARELLECRDAAAAANQALQSLRSGLYAGSNYLCLDPSTAWVIHGGPQPERLLLEPGIHVLTNEGDLDDDQDARLKRVKSLYRQGRPAQPGLSGFLTLGRQLCQLRSGWPGEPPIFRVQQAGYGTVCSTLMAVSRRPGESLYYHQERSQEAGPYEDCSGMLQKIF